MTESPTPASTSDIPRIDERATIDAILRAHPTAVAVFNAFGVDACCGGGRTLVDAAREDDVDLAALLAALEWSTYSVETLGGRATAGCPACT